MIKKRHYTKEEKGELLSNPYTARVTECSVIFTLEFKKFVLANIDKPNMTAVKVFRMAGYNDDLFTPPVRRYIVKSIRAEASSPSGLKEPKTVKEHKPRKKHSETEFKELQERVEILEQQINFLKKSQQLKKQDYLRPPNSIN